MVELGGVGVPTYRNRVVIFHWQKGGQTFHVGDVDDDVDGGWGEDVSEANIRLSEASKLSAGARILRGP